MQGLIDELFQAFVEQVAESRKMEPEEARRHATGEVFTARRGRDLGLIDELGDFDAALDKAAELGQVPRRPMYVTPARNFRQRMFGQFTAWAMEGLVEEMGGPDTRQLWYL